MKKCSKTFKILILTIAILFTSFVNISEAASGFWSDIFNYGEKFLEKGKDDVIINNNVIMSETSDEELRNVIDDIYGILFPLGVVITVIVGGILGIKFMLASAEDRADVKKSMVPYVAGCIVIYGAFGIWRICIEIFSALT